jgi:hypothetical protein
LPGGHAAHDRRRFTKLNGVFSDAGYISIGDPYLDGRTASGPPAGVCGSITSRTGEAKASFFPPRLCWGVRVPVPGPPLLRPAAPPLPPPSCSLGVACACCSPLRACFLPASLPTCD